MINKVGLYQLFGENKKVIKKFIEYCKNCDGFCGYDVENIIFDLELFAIDNTEKFFHFHTGNILDFLEENNYYIGLPIRGKFKFVTCVYKKNGDFVCRPIYNNSGVIGRTRALEIGVTKAIEHLEKEL